MDVIIKEVFSRFTYLERLVVLTGDPMQKPQHKVTVSRSVTEATEGIPNIS